MQPGLRTTGLMEDIFSVLDYTVLLNSESIFFCTFLRQKGNPFLISFLK